MITIENMSSTNRKIVYVRAGVIAMFLISLAVLLMSLYRTKDDFEPLFPFLISYDSPDNVVNMSALLDGPAGKDGFIRVVNGRFVNDAGPVRLNGTNLTGPANFPTREQADRMAARLARFGINCVRLHYMDAAYGNFLEEKQQAIIADDTKTQRLLDSVQLDRLDYLVSQFKKRGIYVNINLHVARKWDERDGFIEKSKRPSFDRGLDNFLPEMIELQKEYAEKLFTRVNPYTEMSYRNDPCVAMIEINNENSLVNYYFRGQLDNLPSVYANEFQRQWNDWLRSKYQTATDGEPMPIVMSKDSTSLARRQDFIHFLYDTEAKYWTTMYNFLRNELKVKSVIAGGQLGFTPPTIQSQLDFVDNHTYWRHPGPVNKNWRIKNDAMVNSMDAIRGLATARIDGLPYTVSEYNHPFPNQYGGEGQPMLRAYGRLQGWDGVFQYTYVHRSDVEPKMNTYFFSMAARTDVLAHMPACATIFLRGDVSEAKDSVVARVGTADYVDRLVSKKQLSMNLGHLGMDTKLALLHKTAIRFSDMTQGINLPTAEVDAQKRVLVSDNGELLWNTEIPNAGYFVVNTANTKLFSGFPAGRNIRIGDVELSIGKTRLNWATISLLSKTGSGFGKNGQPSQILLAATGVMKNTGMDIERMEDDHIRLKDWGTAPVLVEGIPAKITLPAAAKRTKCFALDEHGTRKFEISVSEPAEGKAEIEINPSYQTVWYEITIE